jgi:putative flippase GtrA
MMHLFSKIRRNMFARYLVVSIGALAVDMLVFLALLEASLSSVIASAIGYSAGILAHWILSSRKVFHDRVSERGSVARVQQKAMFVMSALLGLAMTMAIVGAGEMVNLDPRLAKIVAIGISFLSTYLLRNVVVFRHAPTG